jgi:hypothetical protein
MAWYAAHAIVYFEITAGQRDGFHVHENVYVVQADSPDGAWSKAQQFARRDMGDDRGSLRVGDRPARRVFGSIRKLVSVSHEGPDGKLGDGDEVTYSEFVVADRAALDKLIGAEDVDLVYVGKDDGPRDSD